VTEDGEAGLGSYQATRDALVKELLDVTDRIAAFDWDLDRVKALHLELSREMKREVEWMKRWEGGVNADASVPVELDRQPVAT